MSLGSFSKDKLVFDPTVPIESDNIGAFVRAGNDGTQISWTANVNIPASKIEQDITYTAACTDYDAGNSITVTYVSQGPALNQALSISVAGQAITVNLATDGAGADSSTATQIAAAINASLAAAELVSASVSGTGATIQAPVVASALAGGTLKQALDVHNIGSPLNGQFHEDCQHDSGAKGQFILGVRHDANTSMVSHDGDYAPLQMDANGFLKVAAAVTIEPSDAEFTEDSPNNSGDVGLHVLTVRQDTLATSTSANGDYADFKVNNLGELYVHDTSAAGLLTTIDADTGSILTEIQALSQLEDAIAGNGDAGIMALAVRQDSLSSSVSNDGDYGSLKLNSVGELYVTASVNGNVADDAPDAGNPIKVGSRAVSGPLALISADNDRADMISDRYRRLYVNNGSNIAIEDTQVNVDNTAAIAVPSVALAGRRTIMIQNLSNKEIYIGKTGVSSANGFVVGARATISLDIGADVQVFAKGSSASAQDLRVLELA